MRSKASNIIVIGAGAGGLDALDALISSLPVDLRASVFIVQHLVSDDSGDALLRQLARHPGFKARFGTEGLRFAPGRIYVAPAGSHLLLKTDRMLVRRGARENRNRPAIDPLFRSAAVSHGARVIGVVLTGLLDDGTAGLVAIKKGGGVAVVQDPAHAAYPGMPQSALDGLNVDYCVPLGEMGRLLEVLVSKAHKKIRTPPRAVQTEATIAERVLSDVAQVNGLGAQVPYNCPQCGGVLWEMAASKAKRYRCHTGHSFTQPALLSSQAEKIEEMLWISLRMFEERKNLLTSMGKAAVRKSEKASTRQRVRETEGHIQRIRSLLLEPQAQEPADVLTRVKALMAEPRKARSAR